MIQTTIAARLRFDSADAFDEADTLIEIRDRLFEHAEVLEISVERETVDTVEDAEAEHRDNAIAAVSRSHG